MKTEITTVDKHGYVVRVKETNGRYRFYDPKPAYILDEKIYDTKAEAVEAMKAWVTENYGPDAIDDDLTSYYFENGAERDEENYEIYLSVVEINKYKVVTTVEFLVR